MKSIFASKTFWFAVLKVLAGGFVVFGTTYPDLLGWMIGAAGLIDILLRKVTTTAVKL